MAYALTILIMAIFFICFLLTKKQEREVFCPYFDNKIFKIECDRMLKSFDLPSKSSQNNSSKYIRFIKLMQYVLNMKRFRGAFDCFIEDKHILTRLYKIDYSCLDNLPAVRQNEIMSPRMVEIARLILCHNCYKFDENRLLFAINAQNRAKTLTFDEIMSAKECFCYVLLEKLYYIYKQLFAIVRVFRLAKTYANNQNLAVFDKKIKYYAKSPLFLSLCAIEKGYCDSEILAPLKYTIDNIAQEYNQILNTFDTVLAYDFSPLYSPLEIYTKFDTFCNASENAKFNLLQCASSLSDKENVDEFLFAIRVEKLMSTASNIHANIKRFRSLLGVMFLHYHKNDISMLSYALSSQYFMNLFFNFNSKKSKSITKIVDFENTFEPIYKFKSINFGISTQDDYLKINPRLPSNIHSASVVFEHNGVKNTINIQKGEDFQLYLGDTKLSGASQIKLSNKPLNINVVVKK